MDLEKYYLAQNMAFLLSVPPESNLAKLLKFCLATKLDTKHLAKNALEISCALMEDPSSLPVWTHDVMGRDKVYTDEEWAALGEMGIKDVNEFINTLWKELESFNL